MRIRAHICACGDRLSEDMHMCMYVGADDANSTLWMREELWLINSAAISWGQEQDWTMERRRGEVWRRRRRGEHHTEIHTYPSHHSSH